VAPVTLAIQQLLGSRLDVWAVVIGSTTIFLLVIARINLSVNQLKAVDAERQQAQLELAHQATHDGLTGLANRPQAMQLIRSALSRAQRSGAIVGLLFVDLDGFKSVNDTHGHEAGDTLLREVASRLTAEVRGKDTIARLGGDEFVIVMVDTQARPGAENVLERILKRLQEPVEVLPGTYAAIGASVGVAVYPDDAQDVKALLARADEAMFAAKRAGKQRIRFFRDATLAAVEAEAYAVDAARFAAAGMPDTRRKH